MDHKIRETLYNESTNSSVSFINNHHLKFALPKLTQMQSFVYKQRIQVLHETYPDISQSIQYICKTRYSEDLPNEESFLY